MKLKGYKPTDPNIEIVVIPRGDGNDFVFKAQAVLDLEPFEKMCPMPTPPYLIHKDGTEGLDIEDPQFQQKLKDYSLLKSSWMVIQSLKATPDLEWETVKASEPDTWKNWIDELKDFKLGEYEISLILNAVHSANGLDESKIDAARKRFLASQAAMVS
jgi:hypothetical protein